MIRRPPRSTLDRSSAASDVYKRQIILQSLHTPVAHKRIYISENITQNKLIHAHSICLRLKQLTHMYALRRTGEPERRSMKPPTRCLLYTSPSPRDS